MIETMDTSFVEVICLEVYRELHRRKNYLVHASLARLSQAWSRRKVKKAVQVLSSMQRQLTLPLCHEVELLSGGDVRSQHRVQLPCRDRFARSDYG
jgi:hypothetical protein